MKQDSESKPREKKSYRPPKLVSEKLHERAALSCGKNDGIQPSCLIFPTTS